MTESETLAQGIRMGKKVMQEEVVAMFKSMKSNDATDTEYSMANVLTISEAIEAVKGI
jgi:hypothetical protein